jgi:hypothetical protein
MVLGLAATATPMPTKAKAIVDPGSWVFGSDFSAPDFEKATVTTFDLTIDRTGVPIMCTVVIPSGSESVDRTVCAGVMGRARFKAAKDLAGQPLPSMRRDRVVWHPQEGGSNRWFKAPDFVVSTSGLTGRETKTVSTLEIVTDAGQVENCFIDHSSKVASLDDEACDIVRRRTPPISDARGVRVRGVRSFIVGFIAGPDGVVTAR